MIRKLIYLIAGLGIGFIIYSAIGSGESESEYIERITSERLKKHNFMKSSSESPFKNDFDAFTSLNYYDINPEYRVNARIEKFNNRTYVDIGTSDGKTEKYYKFAYAHFELNGQPSKLLLLKPAKSGNKKFIFTAFADDTSSITTYGGGRYLDLSLTNAKFITIDFNLAYNPYCAYNPTYSCPLPPVENILKLSIDAGEKNYSDIMDAKSL